MKLTVIASTTYYGGIDSIKNTDFGKFDIPAYGDSDADRLAHIAGRSCYQSWHMPNPDTATDEGYLANIIKQAHFSVLEHASVTFYVEGVSRNLSHELIRHRHLSFSELSQRFVNMEDANVVIPPAVREMYTDDDPNLPVDGMAAIADDEVIDVYKLVVDNLMAAGKTRKQAREAARFYLPSGMETRIVVTGNHRAWRDMLHKRYSVHADAEIREFAALALAELRKIAPGTYQDFPDSPFE